MAALRILHRVSSCRGTAIVAVAAWVAAMLAGMLSLLAAAQPYPTKPVRVVLSSPGGGTDIVTRLVTDHMSRTLGVPFVVESRQPNVAASAFVARSAPDGYTLMVATASYLVNALLRQPQYDPLRDFSTVSLLGLTPIIIVVHPALPVSSLQGLVALARQRPGELNYGSGGVSSPLHLAGELFNQTFKLNIVHIPFKGTANAATDLQAGRVQVMFPSTISVAPLIKAGRVKVLAMMSDHRTRELPAVPTTAEAGVPALTANIWYAMLAPANTPAPLIERLNKAAVSGLHTPQIAERMQQVGVEAVGNTPEQHAAFAAAEYAKWKHVIDNGKFDLGP